MTTLLGYSDAEINGMGILGLDNLMHPDDQDGVANHYKRYTCLQFDDVLMLN